MKTYNSPMLQVVSIKFNNIIATSGNPETHDANFTGTANDVLAPGRRFDIWYEGY